MIGFRHCDSRYPFLWEDDTQPAARWHSTGSGPAQYLADTPDGAWAEFVRHEEIDDLVTLATVRRTLWAVEFDPSACTDVALDYATLTGDESSYDACRAEAASLRLAGSTGVRAPSAALLPGKAAGYRVDNGLQNGPSRNGEVFVLFGPRPDLVGWRAAGDGRPHPSILDGVRQL